MKNFTRLMLASAIAMSSSAFAMEAMDESALSDTTGQDGISVDITPGTLAFSTVIHDSNGWGAVAPQNTAGAIVIGNPLVAGSFVKTSVAVNGGGVIRLDIDATGDIDSAAGTTTPAIRVGVSVTGTGLTLHTGDISVAASNGLGTPVGTPKKFMNDMTIDIGSGALMNMYLGGESTAAADTAGKHMVELSTSMSSGLSISSFALIDAGGPAAETGGSIQAAKIKLLDNATAGNGNGANLTVNANVDVATDGLLVKVVSLGSTTGANIQIGTAGTPGDGLKFGNAGAVAIGNVDIIGLNMAGTTLKIYGH